MGLWPAGKLESCWQTQTPTADSTPCPTAKHFISTSSVGHRCWKRKVRKPYASVYTGCVERFLQKTDPTRNRIFIHCVSGTAGNGITSMRQHGQSWSRSKHAHKQKLSARLSVRLGFSRRLCLSVILRPLYLSALAISSDSSIRRCGDWIVLDNTGEINMHKSPFHLIYLYTVHFHILSCRGLMPKCVRLFFTSSYHISKRTKEYSLDEIHLIGRDLERHIPVYIRCSRWKCISE